MNEDYLWDKSGQPDPQIQELEEILGTLRYQPRPLEIPQELVTPRRRRNYLPLMAIAATVLLALVATGIWLRVRTQNEPQLREANVLPPPPAVEEKAPTLPRIDPQPPIEQRDDRVVAANNKRRHRSPAPVLGKQEREEALAAKEQVMIALRLASEKLTFAQRKTHNPTPANQIKNQHRVG